MNNDTDRAKQFLAFAALSGFERMLARQQEAAAQKEAPKQQSRSEEFEEPLPDDAI